MCKSGGGERENQVQKISATIQKYVLNMFVIGAGNLPPYVFAHFSSLLTNQ